MRRLRQQRKPNPEDVKRPVPIKYRYPNLVTYDPYLVDIVRMLEHLKKESKH